MAPELWPQQNEANPVRHNGIFKKFLRSNGAPDFMYIHSLTWNNPCTFWFVRLLRVRELARNQGKGYGEPWQDTTFNVEKAASLHFHLRLDLGRLENYARELGATGAASKCKANGWGFNSSELARQTEIRKSMTSCANKWKLQEEELDCNISKNVIVGFHNERISSAIRITPSRHSSMWCSGCTTA